MTDDSNHASPPIDGGHSTVDPRICPFLRATDDDGRLHAPTPSPAPVNRCAAIGDPVPQSLRQQEVVCLQSGHVNCPRYARAAPSPVLLTPATTKASRVRPLVGTGASITPATAASLAILGFAFLVSLAFTLGNGGLVLTSAPTASPSGTLLAAEATPLPSVAATGPASPSPTDMPAPTPDPTVSPTPEPTPTPTPTPRPTSDRYALLVACPDDASDCWIYVIRSGDNLYSIANYFGVSLREVQARNPWTQSGLRVGRELRIPTPTR